jgi:hypothetical protein
MTSGLQTLQRFGLASVLVGALASPAVAQGGSQPATAADMVATYNSLGVGFLAL